MNLTMTKEHLQQLVVQLWAALKAPANHRDIRQGEPELVVGGKVRSMQVRDMSNPTWSDEKLQPNMNRCCP